MQLAGPTSVLLVLAAVVVPVATDGAAAATPRTAHARAAGRAHRVLLVGSYHGRRGNYRTIQGAVNAAKPGDWILVGPGDYKTHSTKAPKRDAESPAGVLVTTPDLVIRGMNRNRVIVDGTKSGPPCSTRTRDQNFGPKEKHQGHLGTNGVMVWQASNVWVQNLTACNFLAGSGGNGNEIWWNDGDDSGKLGRGKGYLGSYMTTTSTYFRDEGTAAQYGIFSSNWRGGTWRISYASNFNDSGYYIGACRQVCNQVVTHAWAEYNALGYSGSNSGGRLIIKHSEFDKNQDGFDTNSQNGDNPPPQNGACPHGGISPITHTHSCWAFMDNYVHDNNNPNVPNAGSASAGPVGTGMSVSGGRNDTIMNNRFENNKAWGVILVPYPDSGPPCTGGINTPIQCVYDDSGDAVIANVFKNNGDYGNPTNGDIAAVNVSPGPTNCFGGNVEVGGAAATTSPVGAESMYPSCTGQTVPPDLNPVFLDEVACDSSNANIAGITTGVLCLPGSHYPRQTKVVMHPLPGAKRGHGHPAIENPASATLKTMPNPCKGVPANPWCPHHDGYVAGARSAAYAGARDRTVRLAGLPPARRTVTT